MAIMFGNGNVADNANDNVTRTVTIRADASGKLPEFFVADVYDAATKGAVRKKVYMKKDNITLSQC